MSLFWPYIWDIDAVVGCSFSVELNLLQERGEGFCIEQESLINFTGAPLSPMLTNCDLGSLFNLWDWN
jgi:hypothetical protein